MNVKNDMSVFDVEHAISKCSLDEARATYRLWLISKLDEPLEGQSIGDLLAYFASKAPEHKDIAIVTLRCASVQGLLPEPNSSNQLMRSVVNLLEINNPNISEFCRVDTKSQTFERFEAYLQLHRNIEELLGCLLSSYGDLDGLVSSRPEVLGRLKHSMVRFYGGPYNLNDFRVSIEALYGRLRSVSQVNDTFLNDVEACQRAIQDVKTVALENFSFISESFIDKFIINVESILEEYLDSMEGEFKSKIEKNFSGDSLKKRYPLHDVDREIRVIIPLKNIGPGTATNVRLSVVTDSDKVVVETIAKTIGNVTLGEFSVSVNVLIVEELDNFELMLEVEWGELGSHKLKTDCFQCRVNAQAGDISWSDLEYWSPYSTEVAEGESFIGRRDRVRHVASKLLRTPMESFYLTGQKRIGKTSLVKAAAEFACSKAVEGNISYHYILWGEVAHANPEQSLRSLGESIEGYILDQLPEGVLFEKGDYDGSLAHLTKVLKFAQNVSSKQNFIVVIDEFDEIHEELFLKGNLATTLFANLRAISRERNFCLALVGGENMPYIMDRQGQKLNNFSRVDLNYFSRDTEWEDFEQLVRHPSLDVLTWHDEAIAEIFNSTNGNPYFAKLVCAGVVHSAIVERDADITAKEVHMSIDEKVSELGTNSFAHLWQDGIPKAVDDREPDILLRMRVFVAIARCLRRGIDCTPTNIADNRASNTLATSEIIPVLNDMHRRGILVEDNGVYTIALPIFKSWLIDVGAKKLVSDSLSEEIAGTVLEQENAAVVLSAEIVELVRSWSTYRGVAIGTDEVRAWMEQVESHRDQRILFKILQKTTIYTEAYIREKLRNLHRTLLGLLPEYVRKSNRDRRNDIVVTYVDGVAKSGATYASLYAEENLISADMVVSKEGFESKVQELKNANSLSAVVIVDDIAATGRTLEELITGFCADNEELLKGVPVKVFSIVSTAVAQKRVTDRISEIESVDIEFRTSEVLGTDKYAFSSDMAGWDTRDEFEHAKALCESLGARIYRRNPLGFGGQGLLVVFPSTVPNNTLPILHSHSKVGSGKTWKPLFPRPTN